MQHTRFGIPHFSTQHSGILRSGTVAARARTGLFATLAALSLAGYAQAQTASKGVYRIPFADGTDVVISSDHVEHGTDSNIAIDMYSKAAGSRVVVAAADGVIRFIEEDNSAKLDCDDLAYSDKKTNYVWIEHPQTGEWTKYSHITKNSATGFGRFVGETVEAGDPLGWEGDVGCASGVHLHFEVGVPRATDPIMAVTGWLEDNADSKRNRIPRICGISTTYFQNAATYTARTVPGAMRLANEAVHRAVPIEDYQCQVDQLAIAGYRVDFIDGFRFNEKRYFNLVSHPANGVRWGTHHELTKQELIDATLDYRNAGFRLQHLESYWTVAGIRYAAIYAREAGPDTTFFADQNAIDYQAWRDEMIDRGFTPLNVSVQSVGGDLRYTTLYQETGLGAWQMRSAVPSADFQSTHDANKAAGRNLIYLNALVHNGQLYYSAIWSSKIPGIYRARLAKDATEMRNAQAEAWSLGMKTLAVTAYDNIDIIRYSAVWRD